MNRFIALIVAVGLLTTGCAKKSMLQWELRTADDEAVEFAQHVDREFTLENADTRLVLKTQKVNDHFQVSAAISGQDVQEYRIRFGEQITLPNGDALSLIDAGRNAPAASGSCCVTCGEWTACGCAVSMSCGSCCVRECCGG